MGTISEKGGVEGGVGFTRRNYMVPVPHADSFEDLNAMLLRDCQAYGRHTISGREKTVLELHELEKGHLVKMPDAVFDNLQPVTCKVDKYCTAIVDKNRYSVPSCFCGIEVSVLLGVDRVNIYQKSKLIASHPRLYGNNKWQLEPDHYLELLEERPGAFNSARPILQWRKSWPASLGTLLTRLCQSLGETKGIKDFINVLMLYRTFDAQDIMAAVEMALESSISSSDGVHHLLLFARDTESHAPSLAQWDSLPPANMEQYSQLEAVK